MKHGPIASTPPDVEHLVSGLPAHSASAVTWMTSSSCPTQGKFNTHIAGASTLSLRLWSVQLPHDFLRTEGVQFHRRIVALLSLRSTSSHRFAMIHRHCIQLTFHISLIQLNMPTKFINRDATFEKMSFTLVFRFQTQIFSLLRQNVF